MRKGAVAINPPALQPALNHDAPDTGHSRQARLLLLADLVRLFLGTTPNCQFTDELGS